MSIYEPIPMPKPKIIVPPTPSLVYLRFQIHKVVKCKKLIELQWRQPYARRDLHAPIIKIDPELYERLKQKQPQPAIVTITLEPRLYRKRPENPEIIREPPEDRIYDIRKIVKIYKPNKTSNFKKPAILVIAEYPYRSTAMEGYDNARIVNEKLVFWYETGNQSRSGNHGKILLIALSRTPIRILRESRSNRGNSSMWIIEYDYHSCRTIDVYETLATHYLNDYAILRIIKDNINNKTYPALELIYHSARKTSAETEHTIEPKDAIELLENSYSTTKTHHTEIYKIKKLPLRLVTIRVSNSGKIYKYEHVVTKELIDKLLSKEG